MSTYLFHTPRLRVRRFRTDDSSNFFLLNGDERVMRYIRPVKDRRASDDLLQETINYYASGGNLGAWAIEELIDGKFVGLVMLKPGSLEEASTEIGYALLEEYWGKGFASEVVRAAIAFARQRGNAGSFFARTDPFNFRSKRLLGRNGFFFKRSILHNGQHSEIYFLQNEGENDLL